MKKRFLSLAFAASALILVGAGCAATSEKPEQAAPSAQAPSQAPEVAPGIAAKCPYDDADLCKFMLNWKEAPSYKATATSKTPGQPMMETSVEQAAGGKDMHMVGKENGKVASEFISLAGTTYMKDLPSGTWLKFPPQEQTGESPTAAEPQVKVTYDDSGDIEKDLTSYEKEGTEACGTSTCFKYKVVDPAASDVQYLWFDDKQYMLRKMRTESKDGGYYEMSIEYGPVTIAPPTGTIKDFSMGAGMPDQETTNTMMDSAQQPDDSSGE